MKKIVYFLILLTLLFGAISTLAQDGDLSSPGILPDSPFYFLKTWKETIQTFFTFGAENKAKQYLHLAEIRLAEYQRMIDKGKTEIAQRTLEKYEKQLNHAIEKIEELKNKGKDIKNLSNDLATTTAKHTEVLERNLEKVPESAKTGIKNALEASRKGIEKIIGKERACVDKCGDRICEEVVCLAIGCPCAETKESCPQDCEVIGFKKVVPTKFAIDKDGNLTLTIKNEAEFSVFIIGFYTSDKSYTRESKTLQPNEEYSVILKDIVDGNEGDSYTIRLNIYYQNLLTGENIENYGTLSGTIGETRMVSEEKLSEIEYQIFSQSLAYRGGSPGGSYFPIKFLFIPSGTEIYKIEGYLKAFNGDRFYARSVGVAVGPSIPVDCQARYYIDWISSNSFAEKNFTLVPSSFKPGINQVTSWISTYEKWAGENSWVSLKLKFYYKGELPHLLTEETVITDAVDPIGCKLITEKVEGWKSYTREKESYQYKIKYPEDWSLSVNLTDSSLYHGPRDIINLLTIRRVDSDIQSVIFYFEIFDKPTEVSIEKWLFDGHKEDLSRKGDWGGIEKVLEKAQAGEKGNLSYFKGKKDSTNIYEVGKAWNNNFYYARYVEGTDYIYSIGIKLPLADKELVSEPDSKYLEIFQKIVADFWFLSQEKLATPYLAYPSDGEIIHTITPSFFIFEISENHIAQFGVWEGDKALFGTDWLTWGMASREGTNQVGPFGKFGWNKTYTVVIRACTDETLTKCSDWTEPTRFTINAGTGKCTETDNGIDYYKAGDTTVEYEVMKDVCLKDTRKMTTELNTLLEYYCTGDPNNPASLIQYLCLQGCSNAACIK